MRKGLEKYLGQTASYSVNVSWDAPVTEYSVENYGSLKDLGEAYRALVVYLVEDALEGGALEVSSAVVRIRALETGENRV